MRTTGLTDENDQLRGAIDDLQPFAVSGRLRRRRDRRRRGAGVDGDRTQRGGRRRAAGRRHRDRHALARGQVGARRRRRRARRCRTRWARRPRTRPRCAPRGCEQLAERLSAPRVDGDVANDLLTVLQAAGFLGFDAVDDSTIADFPGRGAGVVLVVGHRGSRPVRDGRRTRGDGAAGRRRARRSSPTSGSTRPTARREPKPCNPCETADLARTVSTVDDLDQPEGPTTVVLAMSDLFLTPPTVGALRLRPQHPTPPGSGQRVIPWRGGGPGRRLAAAGLVAVVVGAHRARPRAAPRRRRRGHAPHGPGADHLAARRRSGPTSTEAPHPQPRPPVRAVGRRRAWSPTASTGRRRSRAAT